MLGELAAGRPMDRLVCGDVGFGKTEVALRAAFVTAMSGKQVAVVVPTTLLARQHTKTFTERFRGFPVQIGQASRLVSGAELARVKKGIAEGGIDIVVGTHALLGKTIRFKDLGLLVVDEEQHFGVAHKEKLKQLRAEVHVLTLTATPIPRTLQLALSGVRDLSIIASPPVDRLAVRTFVAPFDPVIVREALLRERYRGGQAFYVCPRIEDLAGVKDFLDKTVPEMKVAVAHGQMPPTVLDDIMSAFYDGKYDLLLSTTIIESGLDIPTANTLIVHRADRFGLSQLYQLRGRVGRAKVRAYSLFTLPLERKITYQAERRLKVLQSLDTLGAGFQLASHDLDIRGAGNLLGEEQSGHIKEVGFELYQQMLEEAVTSIKAGITAPVADKWSPSITIGTPVLIPEDYVADLPVRLALYRRLAEIEDEREIEAFGAELADRFGKLPSEVEHLLQIVAIKSLCRRANVEKIDAGPKGAVISFRDDTFANPEGLIAFIREQGHGSARAPGHEGRVVRRLGGAGGAAQGHGGDPAPPGRHRRARQGGVMNRRTDLWRHSLSSMMDTATCSTTRSGTMFGVRGPLRSLVTLLLAAFRRLSGSCPHRRWLLGRLHRRLRASDLRAGPCGGDGGGRPVGRVPRSAGDLAAADRVPAGDGVRRRARNSRPAAARCRDRHRAVGARARPDGGAGGAAAALDRRRAGRRLRDLPWLRPWRRASARRQCGRLFDRLRGRDRNAPSRRHQLRPAGALAGRARGGSHGGRGDRARRRPVPARIGMSALSFMDDQRCICAGAVAAAASSPPMR